jgi:hypothetical protein
VVAFVVSTIIGIVAVALPFRWAMRRRPPGAPLSWGEAMIAATWAFFAMFWWYGVIPHQWLTWADNELNWRKDKALFGPGGILDTITPFDLNYLILRDIIVSAIYGVALAANAVLFVVWQNRGKRKRSTEVAPSRYGRPLVRV